MRNWREALARVTVAMSKRLTGKGFKKVLKSMFHHTNEAKYKPNLGQISETHFAFHSIKDAFCASFCNLAT